MVSATLPQGGDMLVEGQAELSDGAVLLCTVLRLWSMSRSVCGVSTGLASPKIPDFM